MDGSNFRYRFSGNSDTVPVQPSGRRELKPDSSEAVGLLCFPVGVIAGLTLAFRFEMVGAVTAIVSLMAFHIWHFLRSSDWPGGIYFMLFTSPAALFLCSGWLQRRENRSVAASCQDAH